MIARALVLLSVAAVGFAGTTAAAQTVDELVAKNIQAKGGLTKLRAVQTVRQTSELSMPGMRAAVVVLARRPNLLRQEISTGGQTIVNGFDGKVAWQINPITGAKGPMPVTGPQIDAIREQSSFDGPLVDYQARGYQVEFAGTETVNGRRLHRLRIIGKSQPPQDCYLDAETGLEARVVTKTELGTFEQEMADYRSVDGIMMPFSIRTLFNGASRSEITVKTVEFNVAVPEAAFAAP